MTTRHLTLLLQCAAAGALAAGILLLILALLIEH